eukprot:g29547.t1
MQQQLFSPLHPAAVTAAKALPHPAALLSRGCVRQVILRAEVDDTLDSSSDERLDSQLVFKNCYRILYLQST